MMSEKLRENESYFVLDTISVHRKNILSLAEMMVSSRKSIEKCLNINMQKAKDYYSMLQSEHAKLIEHIKESRLCLFEIGEDDLADYANNLANQLATFNLMTPDYSMLFNVLRDFTDKLPVNDTTNASIIGRCMNAVRMGFYPTDIGNIELILKGVSFPPGVI